MAVGITVGSITDEIGAASFVHAFFSTISAHGEPKGWETRFPILMKYLYSGSLPHTKARDALKELREAKSVLSQLPPTAIIWNIEDRSAQPPWGNTIAPTISSLDDYFVSSTGRKVFTLMEEALEASADEKRDAVLK